MSIAKISGYTPTLLRCALALMLALGLGFAAPASAQDVEKTIKTIERSLSGIGFRVSSDPQRAEQEYLEAAEQLEAVKQAAPDNPSIPKIEQKMLDIAAKLEKRLGHPIGGEPSKAAETPTPPAPTTSAQPAQPLTTPAEPAAPAATSAAATEKLPSGVTSRLKDIAKAIAEVDDAVAKNDERALRSAERNLRTAERKMDEIHKNYGDKIPPGHPDVGAAEQNLAKARTDLDAALAGAEAAAAAAMAEQASQRDAMIAGQNKLVDLRSAAVTANDPEAVAQARADFEAFKAENAALFPDDHPAVQDVEKALAQSEALVGVRAASSGWIEKLSPYVTSGGDKMVIAGGTANPQEIIARKAVYDEAVGVFEEYRKAEFPTGKSADLEMIEEKLTAELDAFPAAHAESVATVLDQAGEPIDKDLAALEADQLWKGDPKIQPQTVDRTRMAAHRERISALEQLGFGDAGAAEIRQKLAALEQADAERRGVRAQRTFLRPDAFGDDGLDDIKAIGKDIVATEFGGAEVLRVTVPSAEWKEEDVEEWTDTTQTALRRRITRSVTAEVAARQADGVFRHVLFIAKDKRSDGSWGNLYGHIMFTDPMVEENVSREGP